MTRVFVKRLLYGTNQVAGGVQEKAVEKSVDTVCQIIFQQVKTPRQINYTPKSNESFRYTHETPISVGVPLMLYTRLRDKFVIDFSD